MQISLSNFRFLRNRQWRVRDVSATHPYDFNCKRGEEKIIVEVKGPTSSGQTLVVTKNELAAQCAHHPEQRS